MAIDTVTESRPAYVLESNARYEISPAETPSSLLFDAEVWMGTGLATLDLVAEELQNYESQLSANPGLAAQILYGVIHQLRMSKNVLSVATSRLYEKQGNAGGGAQ